MHVGRNWAGEAIGSGFGTDELESTWQLFHRISLHLMQENAADALMEICVRRMERFPAEYTPISSLTRQPDPAAMNILPAESEIKYGKNRFWFSDQGAK